jgi:hypothetical protein
MQAVKTNAVTTSVTNFCFRTGGCLKQCATACFNITFLPVPLYLLIPIRNVIQCCNVGMMPQFMQCGRNNNNNNNNNTNNNNPSISLSATKENNHYYAWIFIYNFLHTIISVMEVMTTLTFRNPASYI